MKELFKDGTMNVIINVTDHPTKKGDIQYKTSGSILARPPSRVLRAFLKSAKIRGTIHRIDINYSK